MNYKINWNGGDVFAVPDCAVENGLKLASGKAVKVLLYVLKFRNDENMCEFLGISEEDAEDAFSYWEQVGVMYRDGRTPVPSAGGAAEKSAEKSPERTVSAAPAVIPKPAKASSPSEVAARINESNEIRNLFVLIEASLARPLSFDDQRTLIWMYDHLGMGMEVILMLINYCVSIEKANMHYIEKMAVSWSDEGIDTAKKADEKILLLRKRSSLAEKCKISMQINRSLSKKELEYIGSWAARGADIDIVMNAYDRTVDSTGKLSFPYMNKILLDWLDHGVTSSAQADDYSKKTYAADTPRNYSQRGAAPKSMEPSFDLDRIMEHAKNTPLRVRSGD